MSTELLHRDLTYSIIGAAMTVHRELGPGVLESVYQKALMHELTMRHLGFEAEQINQAHHAQVINYLAATGIELGLLINFGEASLRHKRIIRQTRNPFA